MHFEIVHLALSEPGIEGRDLNGVFAMTLTSTRVTRMSPLTKRGYRLDHGLPGGACHVFCRPQNPMELLPNRGRMTRSLTWISPIRVVVLRVMVQYHESRGDADFLLSSFTPRKQG